MIYREKEGVVSELYMEADSSMNWVREDSCWGAVRAPEGIEVSVERFVTEEGTLRERYSFMNRKSKDYFGKEGEISICVPLPDSYESTEICLTGRCHVHLWCDKASTWIKAHRMSGEGSSLGLIVTEGSISGYEVIRDTTRSSNDRGVFYLMVSPQHLLPGESFSIAWDVFAFAGNNEFEQIASKYPNIDIMHPEHMVWFENELSGDKKEMLEADKRMKILPPFEQLLKSRCLFIAKNQQLHNPKSALNGAFLIYDNEENRMYYSDNYDHNGGRERVAMGILLTRYLQMQKARERSDEDLIIEAALEKYTEYIHRELFDRETGVVYNDVGRDNTWNRLYNYPWMAVFFLERYHLYGRSEELTFMYRAMKSYYDQGGEHFYAIAIPMEESLLALKAANMLEEYEWLKTCYVRHGDVIAEQGINYPASEVNFEQSIVAPAVSYLLQLYRITGAEKYLIAGRQQMKVLRAFSGDQPDFHLFENAIRHWDGYWFGKRRMYGDTFPHYWSSLSGLAFYDAFLAGEEGYEEKAENSLRGVLTAFHTDGSASCAYIYPNRVNGTNAGFEDPWANDQDWGMYFYAKFGKCR